MPLSLFVLLVSSVATCLSRSHQPAEHCSGAKIQQQADLDAGGMEVVDDLGLVSRNETLNRFDLNKHSLLNDEVGAEQPNVLAFILHRERGLTLHSNPPAPKFDGKRVRID